MRRVPLEDWRRRAICRDHVGRALTRLTGAIFSPTVRAQEGAVTEETSKQPGDSAQTDTKTAFFLQNTH